MRGAAHGLGGGLGAPIPWIGPRTGPASGHFRSIPKAMSPSASIHIYIPALLTKGRTRIGRGSGITRNTVPERNSGRRDRNSAEVSFPGWPRAPCRVTPMVHGPQTRPLHRSAARKGTFIHEHTAHRPSQFIVKTACTTLPLALKSGPFKFKARQLGRWPRCALVPEHCPGGCFPAAHACPAPAQLLPQSGRAIVPRVPA